MGYDTVQPDDWVAFKLPNESLRVVQVVPHTTIALGKYGAFPCNAILDRPYHLTYEIQEKRPDEDFARLRVVPASELNADALADTSEDTGNGANSEAANAENTIVSAGAGEELALVDEEGRVVARSNREIIDDAARQTLTAAEIEKLKLQGADAGKELIAKLLLSHTAIDQKTGYSLAKYKLLKTKKYIRRFTVLPLDVPLLSQWMLEDRDASKILEMRQEMIALVGCWADVHFVAPPPEGQEAPFAGRWLMVDDTSGMLVAAMAERMGILYRQREQASVVAPETSQQDGQSTSEARDTTTAPDQPRIHSRKRPRGNDLDVPYAPNNTITLIHSNTQPNMAILRYFGYDSADPDPTYPYHPLFTNLLPVSWLQLLSPEHDPTYADQPVEVDQETLSSWKTSRRGTYHRKRRRWARTKHIVDSTRAGNFSGLAVSTLMDKISVLRNALPLLAGGAPIAFYSPTIEPLVELVDAFSIGRRGAWSSNPPPGAEGKSAAELERWPGSDDYPINPMLVLGASIHTCRAKRWQVLEGRTHPVMTERGGADGFVFTGWKAVPFDGKISARGKFKHRRKAES